jgi:hypothetical protein
MDEPKNYIMIFNIRLPIAFFYAMLISCALDMLGIDYTIGKYLRYVIVAAMLIFFLYRYFIYLSLIIAKIELEKKNKKS